jgi:hypothetical protein
MKLSTNMKRTILALFTFTPLFGCGGSGTDAQQFLAGKYVGSIQETDGTVADVEITIESDGTIMGRCDHLTSPGGAPLGNATLAGAFNQSTGFFEIAGKYQSQTPGPPGGGKDLIHVSGKVPSVNLGSDQLLVIDRGIPYQGQLFRSDKG